MLQLSKHTSWFSLILLLAMAMPAQARQLRVAVATKVSLHLAASTPAIITDERDRQLSDLQPQQGLVVTVDRDRIVFGNNQVTQLWVKPQQGGYIWIGDRWYRGTVRVIATKNQLLAINHVDLEQYLYSVLGAEMSPTFPAEALKAQAVAARTYALYRSQSTSNKAFDLDSTQTSQVYPGISGESGTTQAAVNATLGQILTYQGKPILAAFHSSSGGHTENVEDIWSARIPYLRGVLDYDLGSPGYEWTQTFTTAQLSQSLKVQQIRSITPDRTTPYGSVVSLKIDGDTTKIIPGSQFRTALKLRSLRFTISPTPTGFLLTGRGYGHALGMSQWGAYYLAEQGQKYPSILAHYYQGVELVR